MEKCCNNGKGKTIGRQQGEEGACYIFMDITLPREVMHKSVKVSVDC